MCSSDLSSVSLFSANAEGEYVRPDKFIYGDVNQDGEVTVKDVTYIQKGLAEIHYVNAVQRFLADPDNEGFSIKNATAIQKYLAQYETKTPWGEEIVMASQDEFSKNVYFEKHTTLKFIVVKPTDINKKYTLEDFPEYYFKSIQENYYDFGPSIPVSKNYYLFLSNPSEEDALNAIKALDYRANIDLVEVYLEISDQPC